MVRVFLFLAGLCLVVAGVALVSVPSAVVLAGVFTASVAYLMEREATRQARKDRA